VPIKKGAPLGPIPDYKWDGTDRDWDGYALRGTHAGDLPFAYLRGQLVNYYENSEPFVGLFANRIGFTPRRINVVMFPDQDSAEDWYNSVQGNPGLLERFDKLGLIVTALIPGADESGALARGLPVEKNGDTWILSDPSTYIGGRLLMVHAWGSDYINGETSFELDYDAPDGGTSCGSAVTPDANGVFPGPGPCGNSIPVTEEVPLPQDFTEGEIDHETLDADIEAIAEHAESFERLGIVILYDEDAVTTMDWTGYVACFAGALGFECGTQKYEGVNVFEIDNSAYINAINPFVQEILDKIGTEYPIYQNEKTNSISADKILTFFEEDWPPES
jgi:hypothetical protein